MKRFNSMMTMALAASLLIHATDSFADENKAAPYICRLQAIGSAQAFHVDPIPVIKLESEALSPPATPQEWFFNNGDQYSARVIMYANNTLFTARLVAEATETRQAVVSVISLPRLNGSITIKLDVPNGLKNNPYVQRLQLTCFDSETSAELKAKGYLEFKEKEF